MSHSAIVFSPEGTPLLDRTVGELVAERPGRSRVFQALNIDFCCQGGRTVREACERKKLSPDLVVAELEKHDAAAAPDAEENPADLPPAELCEYIVERHHGFLRAELPRLYAMAERVARVHGGHTPSLIEVYQVFHKMAEELADHVAEEEQTVFPAVAALSRGEKPDLSGEEPLGKLFHEHSETGEALERLRELTNGYQPPEEACNTYRALFSGLLDLEEDLHRHIHLENTVLFPAAGQLLAKAAG